MFAGSHAETGDERKAAAALLPHVIGNIQTAAGYGPLRRASGTAAQITVGDPVWQGIRGRAHAGRFGMLWLTALTFSMMKEVRAADPDVVFLDNGDVTYKDLEHGTFELVTKEAIPRHFFVEDPGKTIVLHAQGSAISVNQVTNSPARMAELQAAQQDALATFAKGLGSTGSSTPAFANPLPVQPINFIQPDSASPELNSLPPLPAVNASVPEVILGKLTAPPPPPPTLNAVIGPTETDTVVFDLFTATSGTFLASSANGGALTYGISGGTAGSTVLDGVTYDVSKAGPYGTLYVNSTSGDYTFVPDSGAINALTTPTTTTFTVTVSDGTLSADQDFTIAINGVNDAAIISGATIGSAVEASGVANNTQGTPTATGTLTDTDVDNAANTFTAVSSPTASAGGYGTFTMTAAGVWTYTLDNANSAVQALNVGGTLTDTFTVTTVDGTPQVVTIIINGSNDAAIISGATTGSVIEAGGATPGTPTATGTLTDTDVDNTLNTFTAVSSPTASAGGYGTFTMTAAGVWSYTLNNANSAVQALNDGDTLTDTFTVTTVDGTAQVVTIIINGSDDAAIISGKTTGSVTEAGGVANATPGTPTATGTLTDADVDNAANTFTAVSSPTASAGGYGTFTMTAAGVWTYTLDNANSAVQALNVGGTLTDTFTVTTVDGTAQVVTVTINGANDAAIISGTTTGSVTEAGGDSPGTPTAIGTLTDTDVDNTPNTFTSISSPKESDAGYGTFTMTAAGVWSYTLNNANSAVQALNDGDTLTDTITVTTVDGTAQVVTITITGSNDAAIISGTTTGSVTEAGGVANAKPGAPIATGTLTDADVDNTPNTFTAVSSPTASAGGYGTFTMTAAGVWTYTLNNANSAVQALNVYDTLTDTFTVTTVDGTAQVVTVAINGANDAAIISGTATGSVLEAGGDSPGTPKATGTLTDTDVDNAPNTFTAVSSPTSSDGGYGTFTMTAAGAWTYTLDNNNSVVDALNVGDTLTDTFTVHTADGTTQVVTITIHGASDADPNDFDNLATGTHVISDPPFVFGTPGRDSVAGGGDVAQIIYGGAGDDTLNGTGVNDIIYGGSGNDTIKGNNGDDTIYGGSGNDTINGNNGCDTIIGGFGADYLTGGNGDDRFVYLSVADSHAGQFDTISDFISGSDKIDLTALGALTFSALASASTPVPANTITWLYDSTTNETVVYVNPTDQTLSIGNSGLLEIHLQGIATVQSSDFVFVESSDFVFVAASANVAGEPINLDLAATVENDAAIVTTTAADASSDGTVNDVTLLVDGSPTVQTTEISTSTGYTNDDAKITPASGQSIEQQGVPVAALTENSFAFDQTSAPDSGNQSSSSEASEQGTAAMHGAGALDFEPSSTAPVVFGSGTAGTRGLGDSFHFKDNISGFEATDVVDIADVGHTPASISLRENAAGSSGISEQAQAIELSLPGQYSADNFSTVPDHAARAVATHAPHDLML